MLRWGILSTAKIGREQLIPAILNADNGIITAIASRDEGRAKAVATRFAIPNSFGSYEAMLESDLVDAVYIPLPTSQHVEWAIKAANAGKHVLCEKPISLHADQIDDIIKARDANNVLVSEAFMVTYHPQWHKVRSLIAEGAIGTLRHVQAAFTYYNMDADNMRNIASLGGGALPDIGVYPTVGTRFATGAEPVRVSAKVERDPTFGTDIFTSCRADFGSFEMTMYVSTQMALRQEISFHGDKGWVEVSAPFNAGLYDADYVTWNNADHSEQRKYSFPGVNQYQMQVEAFARAVASDDLKGEEEIFSLESSKNNQKLIDAIFRAGESGNWEDV
ncbi:Gfo/Idh/MocA family protein [Pararhizobium sp. IMCC21322]|uniref:Gfo/Idh/MocA family protein n=1 Tax=Pararhizobium sp. IMCC21322 TaxID=3067903 RepID=UPI00274240E1|nr:Gfo/Idh/MocA family oxidoreductase [Pararhizobium sp. IMCC21322]